MFMVNACNTKYAAIREFIKSAKKIKYHFYRGIMMIIPSNKALMTTVVKTI